MVHGFRGLKNWEKFLEKKLRGFFLRVGKEREKYLDLKQGGIPLGQLRFLSKSNFLRQKLCQPRWQKPCQTFCLAIFMPTQLASSVP